MWKIERERRAREIDILEKTCVSSGTKIERTTA